MTDKERIEQLEYELEKKNKLLQERYTEIVLLNNKVRTIRNQTIDTILIAIKDLTDKNEMLEDRIKDLVGFDVVEKIKSLKEQEL